MNQTEAQEYLVTPTNITDTIINFCINIYSENKPGFIRCLEYPQSKAGRCFENVNNYISEYGGIKVVGWNIVIFKNVFLQAESHAVWEDESGVLYDVSPQEQKAILFLKDNQLQNLESPIKSKYLVLSESKISTEFVKLRESIDERIMLCKPISEQEVLLNLAYINRFNQAQNKNQFCACESGIKYRNCCGKSV